MKFKRDTSVEAVSSRFLDSFVAGHDFMREVESALTARAYLGAIARRVPTIITFQLDARNLRRAMTSRGLGQDFSDQSMIHFALDHDEKLNDK